MTLAQIRFQDFDLTISEQGDTFLARASWPGGRGKAELSTGELIHLALEAGAPASNQPDSAREPRDLFDNLGRKAAGELLYRWVFPPPLSAQLERGLDHVRAKEMGLRIRVRLDDALGLVSLPWEWLRDPQRNRPLALNRRTPIVRFMKLLDPVSPLPVVTPLHLLVMVSIPRGTTGIDAADEWAKLTTALRPSKDAGQVAFEQTEAPTLSSLRHHLDQKPCHAFHFIGHGEAGALLMEDEKGDKKVVSGEELGILLWDYARSWEPPRLVVLNTCQGGAPGAEDAFSGVAQSLMQQGIPAVVAMQSAISDSAAVSFSEGFYEAFAGGADLATSVCQARVFIWTNGQDDEWGTPALYTRLPEARILDVESLTPEQQRQRKERAILGRFWHPTEASEILVLFGKWPKAVTDAGELEEAVPLAYAMLLGELKGFLTEWYPSVEFSDDLKRDDGSRPVIALGGPLSNPRTQQVGDQEQLPIWFRGLPYSKESKRALGTIDDEFASRVGDGGELESDVGFVARLLPKGKQPLFVIAGCYGAGTLGATRCLMDPARLKVPAISDETRGAQVVVRTAVRGWDAEGWEVIQYRTW